MSNSIYTYRLSCLTFRDPSRARRGPPLQVLEEKIRYSGSISNGAIPLVDCRTWQWTDYTIGHRVATALLDEPVSARRISPTRGHRDDGCTGASSAFVFPHLGPTATVAGGVRWNIHDSRIVSERVLNRTKLFARAFFSRESDASNFEIFKGVAIFSFSCFVLSLNFIVQFAINKRTIQHRLQVLQWEWWEFIYLEGKRKLFGIF